MKRRKHGKYEEQSGADRHRGASARPRRRRSLFGNIVRTFFWLGLLGTLTLFGALAGGVVYLSNTIPKPTLAALIAERPTIELRDRYGRTIARRGTAHTHVRLEYLPRYLVQAVVATEDRRFFEHFGVDPKGLARAMLVNLKAGRFVQGGSTITQQLAKNLYLTSERKLRRKVEELLLAVWLERQLSKADIMELYLNRVYFGSGAYGVEAAAWRYFNKPASNLAIGEAAVLAGMLRAPSRYNPERFPKRARSRGRLVVENMLNSKMISSEEARVALATPVVFRRGKRPVDPVSKKSNYAIDWAFEQVPKFVGRLNRSLVIETTIDSGLQAKAQEVVAAKLEKFSKKNRVNQAALVVMDRSGAIVALVGGREYTPRGYNRATQARRQPGSAFKPFVYLTALERGYDPRAVTLDAPIRIGNWTPQNYSKRYRGSVTLTEALARSINTVAVRLAQEVGIANVIATAKRLGIRSKLNRNLSLALGTSGVTPLEMAGAYAAFSNGGYAVRPFIIKRVSTPKGDVIYERRDGFLGRAMTPRSVWGMNVMLGAVVAYGTGRQAQLRRIPVAGKTGTTQKFRDGWFVGYSANYTAAVWTGNDDNSPTKKVSGGGLAALIWREVMEDAHSRRLPAPVPTPTPAAPAAPMAVGTAGETGARAPAAGPLAGTYTPAPVPGSDPAFVGRASDRMGREDAEFLRRLRGAGIGTGGN